MEEDEGESGRMRDEVDVKHGKECGRMEVRQRGGETSFMRFQTPDP